jgi:uncharacterized membrane protein YhfC
MRNRLRAVVCFVILTLWWLGRSFRTHLVLLEGILMGALGFTLSAYTLGRKADIEFDLGPRARHRAA